MTTSRNSVFACYAHENAKWLKRIQVHLTPFVREGLLDLWADTRIRGGEIWREEIDQALSRARVAILIVSPDFLASNFIAEYELPRLLKKAAEGGATILSVIVEPCNFSGHQELSKFQAVNPPDQPLSRKSKPAGEAYLVELAKEVERILKNP